MTSDYYIEPHHEDDDWFYTMVLSPEKYNTPGYDRLVNLFRGRNEYRRDRSAERIAELEEKLSKTHMKLENRTVALLAVGLGAAVLIADRLLDGEILKMR